MFQYAIITIIFVIVLNFLGLDELILLLSLDGPGERSVMVSVFVVANEASVEGLVEHKSTEDNVGVVQLVVVAEPRAAESPAGLPLRRGSESRYLLRLAAYRNIIEVRLVIEKVEVSLDIE